MLEPLREEQSNESLLLTLRDIATLFSFSELPECCQVFR